MRREQGGAVEVARMRSASKDRWRRGRHPHLLIIVSGGILVLALLLVLAASIALLRPRTTPAPAPAVSSLLPTPTAFVLLPNHAFWSDTARRVALVYPTTWKIALPSDSTLRLTARDGTTFLLYDTNFNRSAADGMAAVQRAHAAETSSDYDPDRATRNYLDGPVSDTLIGNEPAQEMDYTSVSKLTPTEPARHGTIVTVTHAASQYTIQVEYGSAGANTDVAGITASIRFIQPPTPIAARLDTPGMAG